MQDEHAVLSSACPLRDAHTPSPSHYSDWHDWAERMKQTHEQVRCAGCGLWLVWVPKKENADVKA